MCALLAPAQDSRSWRAELSRLWTEQRYDELVRAAESRLAKEKDAADVWIMAAEASLKLERYDAAIEQFERGRGLAKAMAPLTINLGFAYFKADRMDDAAGVFRNFLDDGNAERCAKAHYGLGLVHAARGASSEAKKSFERADALDPSDARAPYRLGQLALESGGAETAISRFNAAIARDPLHLGAAHGLARCHALLGHADEAAAWTGRHAKILETTDAVTTMIQNLGRAADPVRARVAIGRMLDGVGARGQARAWYERALKLDPNDAEALRLARDARPETRR